MRIPPLFMILALACNTGPGGDGKDPGGTGGPSDTDSEPDPDPDTEDCGDAPSAASLPTDASCEYVPTASGNPFSVQVEWSMAHEMTDPADASVVHPAYTFADEPAYVGVFQAPAVSQATDDNGDGLVDAGDTPDIALLMGDEFSGDTWSGLRLISGDGSQVHDTTVWQAFEGDQYAPFLFAGVAMADTDLDGATEIVTTVTRQSDDACFPALYEVSPTGTLTLEAVGSADLWCQAAGYSTKSAHAPALSDIDGDGIVDVILGRSVYAGDDLDLKWEGAGGRGWYNAWFVGAEGYWNSGFHSFAHDMDGDGLDMEVVAGSTVYTSQGGIYCELGRYESGSWVAAEDGYPAVADMARFSGDRSGEPEIVLTGNQRVSLYHGDVRYDPSGLDRCVEIDSITNDPYRTSIGEELPAHPDCDQSRRSFGGPPTVADFTGDGTREVGVAGACWYTVIDVDAGGVQYAALTQTRDWSSASTGSTVFDFNGDGTDEIVFSDEDAVYVWQYDKSAGLRPWERLATVLEDQNHKSWTIHEYPLVADVDGDGKAELIALNSPRPDHADHYGLYVLGAADDDWVSARPVWNQHAYFISNIEDDFGVGYAAPNYAPYSGEDHNSFRLQAPGSFGALAAPNLLAQTEACQASCGDPATIWVQVGNEGAYITASAGLAVALYGQTGGSRTLIRTQPLPVDATPGSLTAAVRFEVANWFDYDAIVAVVDDPTGTSAAWGAAKECDETDNEAVVDLSALCE